MKNKMSAVPLTILFFFIGAILGQQQPDPYSRFADPVVLTGVDVPEVLGFKPENIVGFSYSRSSGRFTQVPVQVDEKHYQQWHVLKDEDCWTIDRDLEHLIWADANTWSGPDENPDFDDDDELVFMAKHLGELYDGVGTWPPNTFPRDKPIEIIDPVDANNTLGVIYVMVSLDGSLNPNAGNPLVDYDFQLVNSVNGSNAYKVAYQNHCPEGDQITDYECRDSLMNPEDSWFVSNYYERHFSENWHSDQIKIKSGNATGENFLSLQEYQFLLGSVL